MKQRSDRGLRTSAEPKSPGKPDGLLDPVNGGCRDFPEHAGRGSGRAPASPPDTRCVTIARWLKSGQPCTTSPDLGRISAPRGSTHRRQVGDPYSAEPPGKGENEEHEGDNPALSNVIERNIRDIINSRSKAACKRSIQDRIADVLTSYSGRMPFVYLHVVWFGLWIPLNTGRLGVRPFDPFPYGLSTMIVSLEGIFLSAFVLISQNRLSEEAERRANLDLQIGLLIQHELTHVLKMLDGIQGKLGIENDAGSELADLEMETKPEDVLAEIERLQRRASCGKNPSSRDKAQPG